jgi:hypothetical protein
VESVGAASEKRPPAAKAGLIAGSNGTAEQAAEKCNKTSEKSFLQGLKPVASTQLTSALKHRPPKEKDFFADCEAVRWRCLTDSQTSDSGFTEKRFRR